MTIAADKKILRREAREKRALLAAATPDFAERIAEHAVALQISAGEIVGGYIALKDEADPRRLIAALHAMGAAICYPRVREKGHPLDFHGAMPGETMVAGAFGIPEPRANWPIAFPPVVLVPLLAYDAQGFRLGYGGGYYDRTLAKLGADQKIKAIGVAFAGQEVERVPRDSGDKQLDMIVTERGVRRFA